MARSISRSLLSHRSWLGIFAIVMVASACGRVRPAVTPALQPSMMAIVPLPVTVEPQKAPGFPITASTTIAIPAGAGPIVDVARRLARMLAAPASALPQIIEGEARDGSISLAIRTGDPSLGPEAYAVTISTARVAVEAGDAAGLFYAVQTIRQLLPPSVEYEAARPRPMLIPAGRIVDRPRFAWRGAMLDVSRHFFTLEEVKRYIDLLALYKMNRLHLHLADDQGWRIEIKSWPRLALHGGSTEVGGGPGGYYTQEQYGELIAYAQAHFITIIPEIDMPSHINAALASYPELNCDGVAPPLYTGIEVGFSVLCVDKEITYKFIGDVVGEIAAMTPAPYFHIGGDEVKKLTREQYSQFIERAQAIVHERGKQMIGWDEIVSARLLPSTIVQHWRPARELALPGGVQVVLSPANRLYLDMKYNDATVLGLNWAGYVEVKDAYDWDPTTLLDGVAESRIAGVEAPMWSETLANIRDVEYLAFPRLAAAAEVGWSRHEHRQWSDFERRLSAQAPRWTALGVNFYRSTQVRWPSPPP